MAKQTLNIGAVPNDGTGDSLRDGMDKVNDNFDELYLVKQDFIELLVIDPSITGYTAPIGTEGYNTESPPKFYKKVGATDTDWELILTSTDGVFVANIELADATGQVLGDNVLGQVDGRLAIGDGVTTGGNQIVTKHNDGEKLTIDDWNWTFSSGVGVLDTSPTQSATALNIPAVGFPQKIDDNKFGSETLWTSLTMPNSVTSIGTYAFSNCNGLTGSLTIPNSVTTIGSYAFYYCTGLTSLSIGSSVTSIAEGAFASCSGFTGSLTIPNSVTSIGNYAFSYCSGFTGSLTIPNSITSISDGAFYGCTGFTGSLTIPNSVTSIGSSAFYSCTGFTGSLTIPNSVTSIGSNAFNSCTGFTGSLTIPNSVTTIGNYAFSYCTGFTGSLTIPNSVTSIADGAFASCLGFTGSLTIPNSVTSIGSYAFSYCSGFTGSLTIPNSVTSIGNYVFSNCYGFTGSLTIPNSVTSIGSSAFYYCSGLTTVDCYITKTIIDAATNCFVNTGITTLHAQSSDGTWSAGAGQTIGGKTGITVIKDL